MKPVALIEQLIEQPHGFGFFQALNLLERWFAREQGQSRAQMLSTRVAFRNSLSMAFPASEIESLRVVWRELKEAETASAPPPVRAIEQLERIELTPAFMGLLGAGGALPSHYTETLAGRETYQRDGAARAFMDIFLHRALALFYQAWRKHRLALQFEADRRNQFLPLVLAVAGIGHHSLRERLHARQAGVADDALAHFAGSLQRRPVSAHTIERVLAYYFRIGVKLEQFVGRWFQLPKSNQSTVGLSNMTLGRDMVVGERVWQRDLRLRLTLGPLSRERFQRFLPGGAGALALRELLGLLSGPTLEYEVRLELLAKDVSGTVLGAADAPRLGWDSFLVTQPQTGSRTDAGYDLLALA
jgi:type VI secretion system protein ImpH